MIKGFLIVFLLFSHSLFPLSSLPLTIRHMIPLIPVEIQNEPLDLIFDLGSSELALDKKIISRMDLPVLEKTKTSSNIFGVKRVLNYYLADRVKIGDVTLRKFGIRESFDGNPESIPKELSYGAVGREFFLDKFLIVDYRNQTILFDFAKKKESNIPESYSKRKWIPCDFYFTENSEVIISLFIGNKNCQMLLDTGTNFCLLNHYDKKVEKEIKLPIHFKNGKLDGEYKFKTFQNDAFDFDGILGFDFFNNHVVYLDFVNRKMLIN